jgi:hypothetical protein
MDSHLNGNRYIISKDESHMDSHLNGNRYIISKDESHAHGEPPDRKQKHH